MFDIDPTTAGDKNKFKNMKVNPDDDSEIKTGDPDEVLKKYNIDLDFDDELDEMEDIAFREHLKE